MSNLYRTRVCAIGSEEDIRVLLIRMLENFGVYEEPEDRSPYTRAELEAWVRREAGENGGPGDTFLYEMIAPLCYGDAEPGTCRLTPADGGRHALPMTVSIPSSPMSGWTCTITRAAC